jgi:Type I phosphodiesterase / nucleotide pyrophosphatase
MSQRVLLCSLDGVRPDAILACHTPTIQRLAREGAHTWKASSVMPSVTLPCHTSMLRGVDVPRHGITSNTFTPLARPVPSVMDAAASYGKRVGFFYNWEQLRDLAAPGSLKVSVCFGEGHVFETDQKVADAAIAALTTDSLDFVFVYFGHPDEAGHAQVLAHWDGIVCVVSDHGGHERSHGTDSPEDMTIPFILNGPGIAAGRELTEPIYLYDVCPTLAHALGIPACREWDGRVVAEAFL